MENLSPADETLTLPVTVPVAAYLRDHRIAGGVVLPAVEALQLLARTLPAETPADPLIQMEASFTHLLVIEAQAGAIEAVHAFSRLADGRCLSRLMTRRSGVQARWTRKVEHAAVIFSPGGIRERGEGARHSPTSAEGREGGAFSRGRPENPEGGAAVGDGTVTVEAYAGMTADEGRSGSSAVFRFPAQRLYAELVPFGPAYQNVTGEVFLTPAGAAAEVLGGDWPEASGPLGSPFPLDAAFHLACAWGQRYRGRMVYPVGFERREILRPTLTGERYRCLVVPRPGEGTSLRFDLTIFDAAGRPAEIVRGLRMRDIAGGSRRPPAWVREGL